MVVSQFIYTSGASWKQTCDCDTFQKSISTRAGNSTVVWSFAVKTLSRHSSSTRLPVQMQMLLLLRVATTASPQEPLSLGQGAIRCNSFLLSFLSIVHGRRRMLPSEGVCDGSRSEERVLQRCFFSFTVMFNSRPNMDWSLNYCNDPPLQGRFLR